MPANALTITEKSLRLLGVSLTLYVATKLPPSLNLRVNVLENMYLGRFWDSVAFSPLAPTCSDPHFDKQ